jgi:hypothetical protein
MFFAEFTSGYASAKGEIANNSYAVNATKEMVHQVMGLIRVDLKYPEEFKSPLPRFVREKYSL